MTTTSTTLAPATTNEGFPERFVKIAPSQNFTYFLQASGKLWSTGSNDSGQLNDGSVNPSLQAKIIARGVVDVDVGSDHAGWINSSGYLYLVGNGYHGELGIDPNLIVDDFGSPTKNYLEEARRVSTSTTLDLALAPRISLCLVEQIPGAGYGIVKACGDNANSYLCVDSDEPFIIEFTEVVGLPNNIVSIDAGFDHFCAIDTDGALWAWGNNSFGKARGDGSTDPLLIPRKVVNSGVAKVSCGENSTIITMESGRILATGSTGRSISSRWYDVFGETSRNYSLIETWNAQPEMIWQMDVLWLGDQGVLITLANHFTFKFIPDFYSEYQETKLGTIFAKYNNETTGTSYSSVEVTFQEVELGQYEPSTLTLNGWGAGLSEPGLLLTYTIEQATTTQEGTTEEPTTTQEVTTSSTTLEPTTSTSTTSTSTTSTSTTSTTIDPATLDSDSDGLNDAEDYFYLDSRISVTEAELQTWVSDPDTPLDNNSTDPIVIRALRTYDNTLELGKFYLFAQDNYGVVEMTDQAGSSDGSLSADLSARGEGWEVIKPFIATTTSSTTTSTTSTTSSTTEEPTTSTTTTSTTTSTTEEPTTTTSSTTTSTTSTTTSSTTELPTTTTSTTIDPATIDSDKDGVNDAEDYFYLDEYEVVTRAELESFGFDPSSAIADWDRIKFISNGGNPEMHPGMIPGEFYLIGQAEEFGWRVTDRDGDVFDSSGNVLRVYSADRGVLWEKLNNIPTTTTSTTTTSTTTSTTSTTLAPVPYSLYGSDGDNIGRSLSFNADGSVLAVNSDTSVRVYMVNGDELNQLGQDISISSNTYSSSALTDDGMTLAVGDPVANQVRVYRFNGSTWDSPESVPNPVNNSTTQRFGWDVDISSNGEVLIASDPWRDAGADSVSGSVYVYFFDGVSWELTSSIEPTDVGSGAYFGISISMDANGSNLVVGASSYGQVIGLTNIGQVRHYSIDSSLNTYLENTIYSSLGQIPGDKFGEVVSMNSDGTIFAVGSRWADSADVSSGIVEVFENVSGTWSLKGQVLTAQNRRDYFGYDVALSGDGTKFIAGATGHEVVVGGTTLYDAGKAEVYTYEFGQWVITEQIVGTEGSENMGNKVAMSRDGLIGAVSSPRYGADAGAVSLIDITTTGSGSGSGSNGTTATLPPVQEYEPPIWSLAISIDTWWEFARAISTDSEGCKSVNWNFIEVLPPGVIFEIIEKLEDTCGNVFWKVGVVGEYRETFQGHYFLDQSEAGTKWLPAVYHSG